MLGRPLPVGKELEERLRPTGRRLRPIGWHGYALGPNLAVLTTEERSDLGEEVCAIPDSTQGEAGALLQFLEGVRKPASSGPEPGWPP